MATENSREPAGYAEAIAAFRAGRTADSCRLLEKSLEDNPAHVGTRFGLGVCYARQGDTSRAEAMLRSVTVLNPDHISARVELARLLTAAGRSEGAEQEWQTVLRLDPGHAEARRHSGTAQQGQKAPTAATANVTPHLAAAASAAGTPSIPAQDSHLPRPSTLAKILDTGDAEQQHTLPGELRHKGHRGLLSHRSMWVGGLVLLLLPLLKFGQRQAGNAIPSGGVSAVGGGARPFVIAQLGVLAIAVALILVAVLSAVLTRYTVWERRIDIQRGVLNRSRRSVWLYDINDIQMIQTPLLLLAGTGKLLLMAEEPNPSPKTAPALTGFGSARFLAGLQEELQSSIIRERRDMKKQFV
jgi:hypothetical protein